MNVNPFKKQYNPLVLHTDNTDTIPETSPIIHQSTADQATTDPQNCTYRSTKCT